MSYILRITSTALKDLQRHKKLGNKKILEKISILLEELKEHPRTGTDQPEKLKYDLEGFYSIRLID